MTISLIFFTPFMSTISKTSLYILLLFLKKKTSLDIFLVLVEIVCFHILEYKDQLSHYKTKSKVVVLREMEMKCHNLKLLILCRLRFALARFFSCGLKTKMDLKISFHTLQENNVLASLGNPL